jgi:hypothetical protein
MNKEMHLDKIMAEIINLYNAQIEDERTQQIRKFIDSTVNGDAIQAHLTISANLDETKKGIIIYIVTNLRMIKVDVNKVTEEITSSIFPIDTITGIERKLLKDGKAQVKILFPNSFFGLIYRSDDEAVNDFFQKIDLARAQG